MTAQVASDADARIRVWCDDPQCPRPLDMRVNDFLHAGNLAAKHDREYHAEPASVAPVVSYDVSAAAGIYLRSHDQGVRTIWEALTGLTGQAAEDHAEHVYAHATTAHVAPF